MTTLVPDLSPTGHINIAIPAIPNPGCCETSDAAPKRQKPAYSQHKDTLQSTMSHWKFSATNQLKHAHLKMSNCAKDFKIGMFYQIELSDGTRIVVPNLHTTTREFVNEIVFYCFDSEGKLVPVLLPPTTSKHSSSAFCRQRSYSKPASTSMFCL